MDDSIKFAWAYLLTYGKITSGEWSFFGSGWESISNKYGSWEREKEQMRELQFDAPTIGIDWSKTTVPEVREESGFNGTDSDSERCLATIGILYLKDGRKFLVGSSDDDAAHLAKTAQELMKGRSSIQELAEKL